MRPEIGRTELLMFGAYLVGLGLIDGISLNGLVDDQKDVYSK
jgi:hypothetical protein